MASVAISKGIDPLTDAHSVPRDQWSKLVTARKYSCLTETPTDCRNLLKFVADAAECEWLGYSSRDEYLRVGLDLEPETVDLAVAFLHAMDIDLPVEFEKAVEGGRNLAGHGKDANAERDGSGRFKPEIASATSGYSGGIGRGREYTIARLYRDNPDLAAKVRSGELSANAAAIQAGFRKPVTPLAILRSAWKRASKAEQKQFLDEVSE